MGIVVDLASVPELLEASAELRKLAFRQGEVNMALSLVRQRLVDEDLVDELERRLLDMDPTSMAGFVSRLLGTGDPDEIVDVLRSSSGSLRP